MKTIREMIYENYQYTINETDADEKSIKDVKSFRDYAENKFKTVFGDKLDKDKMNNIIDGIINDNKQLVDDKEFGKLIGILNKSFGG